MPTSTYSSEFRHHWLATPVAIKQAFYQELDDIADMLQSSVSVDSFAFTYRDFNATIEALLPTDDVPLPKYTSALEDTDTPETADKPKLNLSDEDRQAIEQKIYDKLSAQIDDFLSEHLSQLSDDLKLWLKSTINNELN